MDRSGGQLAVGHGLDGDARSKGGIAAGEHAGRRCGESVRIYGDGSGLAQLDAIVRAEEAEVGLLADGQNDRVGLDGHRPGGVELRVEAAAVIENPGHRGELDASDVVVADDSLRAPGRVQPDPLLCGFVELVLSLNGARGGQLVQ